jgi:hypothetical protein
MKKVLIIHGWESGSKEHWYQEEKSILEKRGYEVFVPDMPNTNFPVEKEWVKIVEDFSPNENDILIGHSLGAPTILRYLEKARGKVGKVFLIAGFASELKLDYPSTQYPQSFVKRDFNWQRIKDNVGRAFVINQKDDEWVPKEKGEEIVQNIDGRFILVDGNNHFDKMDLNLINNYL